MFANNYLNKSKFFERKIISIVNPKLDAIVVIPCYNEDFIFNTLESLNLALQKCTNKLVELIIVINSSENSPIEHVKNNIKVYNYLLDISNNCTIHFNFSLHLILLEKIPSKIAGVGYARRIGMDEALCRFNDISNPNGLIISLDADSLVSENYFKKIFSFHRNNPKIESFVLGFKHNFNENFFSKDEISACKLYEKYLLYHKNMLKSSGFPHYFHTIGSCFGFIANAYIKAGAMPCRQAGEDFYFIHKLANFANIGEISDILVFPAPRISNRVPFGTGKAIANIIENKYIDVYNPKLYKILKNFFSSFDLFYEIKTINIDLISKYIVNFVGKEKLNNIFNDCFKNSSSYKLFKKRLFVHFNAFWIIKFFNSFKTNSDFSTERWYIND